MRLSVALILLSCCGKLWGSVDFTWDAQLNAVRELMASGEWDEARSTAEALLTNDEIPRMSVLELLGDIAFKQKKLCVAAGYYFRAGEISEAEKQQRYYVLCADAYYQSGHYLPALKIYEYCYKNDPNEELLFRYFCALLRTDQVDVAKGIEFTSERLQIRKAWNLATYLNKKRNFTEAIDVLQPWIQKKIKDGAFFSLCAQMQYRLGQFEEALQTIILGESIGNQIEENYRHDLQLLRMRIGCRCGREELQSVAPEIIQKNEKRYLLWRCLGFLETTDWDNYQQANIELSEKFPELARYIEAHALMLRGRHADALTLFRELENSSTEVGMLSAYHSKFIASYF